MHNVSKKIVLILALSFAGFEFTGASLWAQTAPAKPAQTPPVAQVAPTPKQAPLPLGPIDGTLLAFDLGMTSGFDLATSDTIVGRSFGLSLIVADNIAVGLASTMAGANYSFLRFGYSLSPSLGFDLYVGSDGATAAGLGAFVNLRKDKTDAGIYSTLKLRLQYLFDTTAGLANGDLVLAVASSIGI
jgi:hypothetical protein